MKRLVVKFGGTSVGNAKAIGQAADIVRDLRAEGHHVAVVTSAMSGVTDALLGGASAATSGHPDKVRGFAQTVRAKHEQAGIPFNGVDTHCGVLLAEKGSWSPPDSRRLRGERVSVSPPYPRISRSQLRP